MHRIVNKHTALDEALNQVAACRAGNEHDESVMLRAMEFMSRAERQNLTTTCALSGMGHGKTLQYNIERLHMLETINNPLDYRLKI